MSTLLLALTLQLALADEPVHDKSIHPAVAAREAAAEAAAEAARASRAWPDPVLSVELSNLPVTSLTLSSHPMSGVQLAVRQALPLVGRLRALEARQEVERALAADLGDTHVRAVLHAQASAARTRLARLDALVAVLDDHARRLDQLRQAVRVRYEVGGAGQGELLALDLRRDQLAEDRRDLEAARPGLEAALVAASGGPPSSPTPTPTLQAIPAPPDTAAWRAAARDQSAEARHLTAARDRADADADVARATGRPEPSAWVGYRLRAVQTNDAGVDFVGAGVAVPIPVFSARRTSRLVDAAVARRREDEARFDAWLLRAEADLTDAWSTWSRAAQRAATRQTELIPDARRALEALLSDYRVGRTDFGALVAAEVVVLDLEGEAIRSAAETHLQAARVAELLAVPLDQVTRP